jgi:hypothetical protein
LEKNLRIKRERISKTNFIQTFLNELFLNSLSNEHKGGYTILFYTIWRW